MQEKDVKQMGAAVFPLTATEADDLAAIVERIGADPRSLRYLGPKRRVLHLFVPEADYRAAAFLKQELLARGGDAIVARGVIDGTCKTSGVLLMGTDSQIDRLLQKLESLDCWGLPELRAALSSAVRGLRADRWRFALPGGRSLELNRETKVMGILNLTPDSFHPGSRVNDTDDLLRRAQEMLADGADVLDLGAESTRPGSLPVSEKDELERLLPALRALRRACPDAVISVDTYKGAVARAAAEEGADVINDVGGFLLDEAMLPCAAATGLPYILSHIKGRPSTMQDVPPSEDLMTELHLYFEERLRAAEAAGLSRDRIILDPGIGFGKGGQENLTLLKELEALRVHGLPVLIGHSRKRFTSSGEDRPGDRLQRTAAVSALLEGRVEMIRVHDVRENRQALSMARAMRGAAPWSR